MANRQRHEDHVDEIALNVGRQVRQFAQQWRSTAGAEPLGAAIVKESLHLHGRQMVFLQARCQREADVVVAGDDDAPRVRRIGKYMAHHGAQNHIDNDQHGGRNQGPGQYHAPRVLGRELGDVADDQQSTEQHRPAGYDVEGDATPLSERVARHAHRGFEHHPGQRRDQHAQSNKIGAEGRVVDPTGDDQATNRYGRRQSRPYDRQQLRNLVLEDYRLVHRRISTPDGAGQY